VQGVLERANIKLAAVATDLMGVSARAILAALVEGRADPASMAELAKRRMRRKMPLLEQALTGLVRDHHRQLLALQLTHIDFLDEQIEALSAEMTRRLAALSADASSGESPGAMGEAGHAPGHHSRSQSAGQGAAGGRVGR
jgi:transposase